MPDHGIGLSARAGEGGYSNGHLCTEPNQPVTILPTDSKARKETPLYSGLVKYFPRALAAVAQVSWIGNEKHNPGEPLHWARDKSADHLDCIARHLLEAGTIDPDSKVRHSAQLAWRALANLEIELEKADAPSGQV